MGHDLHLPTDGPPTAAAVVVHPHPGMGGDRHHPLVVAVAERLAEAGMAALRIDLPDPDVGASVPALEDAAARLLEETGTDRLVLVGYSWGTRVVTTAAAPHVVARVLVAPPVSMVDLDGPDDDAPTLVLVPAHDQYGSPEAVRAVAATWPLTTVEVVEGADHFLVGAVARIADRATGWLTALR